VENLQEFISGYGQQSTSSNGLRPIQQMISDGNAAYRAFASHGDLENLDQAISITRAAANVALENEPELPGIFSNLGMFLFFRFQRLGKVADLNEAIDIQELAVGLTPEDYPDKSGILNNLGISLRERFKRLGNLSDLDGAIIRQQTAVNLAADSSLDKSTCLEHLGVSLSVRFERLGTLGDLDAAIIHQQAAVDIIPDGHSNKPACLNNLGISLSIRFIRLGNMRDINDSIIRQQTAVNLTPDDHPSKPRHLINLGNFLHTRFKRIRNPSDLDDAIVQQQKAIHSIPHDHPDKPGYLNGLGTTLLTRFERLGNLGDIDHVISHLQEAVKATSDDNPSKPGYLSNLGIAFSKRFTRFGDLHDANTAISHFSASVQSSVGSPAVRFTAVEQWISIASLSNHSSLLNAYECAVGLMPLVAWLGLPLADRHEELVKMGGIVRNAAAAAISFEQYDKALEWLEQGRSIVWNQILQLRTPVDELRSINSDLAERLLHVSRLLDGGVEQKGSQRSTEEDAQRYRALTAEWESIIKQVRSLPKFEDFLKPSKISRLKYAAQNGPVVVLNIAKKRCDALALLTGMDEVVHIPLPDITFERITELRDDLKELLNSRGIRLRGDRADRAAQKWTYGVSNNPCKDILAELWNGIVKPVLDSLAFSVRIN
jgi:tetratricopeptide (TPR) repeat protein